MFMSWRALGPAPWLSMITKEVGLPSDCGTGSWLGWSDREGVASSVVKRFRLGGLHFFLLESRMRRDLGTEKPHLSSGRSCSFSALSVLFDGGWMRSTTGLWEGWRVGGGM